MSDLIREIDEEVAKDKSEQFFEKWGLPFGVFLALVVVGLFLFFNWQSRSQNAALQQANDFTAAVNQLDTDPVAAELLLGDLADGGSSYAELSSFAVGNALWNQGEQATACSSWANYAKDATNNENLTNTARLKVAWLCQGVLQPVEIITEIEILEQLEAYQAYTPVLRALVAIEAGNIDEAKTLLDDVSAENSDNTLVIELAGSVRSLVNGL